jgi:hypothetical protein
MAELYQDLNQHKYRKHVSSDQQSSSYDQPGAFEHISSYLSSLRGASGLGSSVNSSTRASAIHSLQRTHGNRAVQRFTEPAPWLGHGARQSDQGGQPFLPPNIGIEPAGYGSGGGGGMFGGLLGGLNRYFGSGGSGYGGGMPLGEWQPDSPSSGSGSLSGAISRVAGAAAGYGSGSGYGGGMPLGEIQPEPGYTSGSQWQQAPHGPGFAPTGGDPGGPFPFFNPTLDVPLPWRPMNGGGTGFGWEPPQKGEMPGPYAYYKGNDKKGFDFGVEGGVGLFHGEGDIFGVPVTDDILFANGKIGGWQDGKDKRNGFNFNGGVGKATINQGGIISGDIGVGTAGAEVSYGTDGLTAGATANLVEGSMTFGAPDKNNPYDESVRIGGSVGMGYAGRLHWGDKDGDGSAEYGFGFDAGPLSLDMKSEDPLRSIAKYAAPSFGSFLPEGNLTNYVGHQASSMWDSAKEYLPW